MPGTKPTESARRGSALRAAFPLTVPILAGFLLTGATCGIYATSLGLPWWTPTFMAIAIYAGSAEFIVASMLVEPFNPLATFVTIFAVNARHLFYGLSMLDRYARVRRRPYLIYAMCDETFSVNFAATCPADVDESDFHFWISFLNQAYWVIGCTLGGIFGSVLAVSVKGISFALTALFVVIFLDQWLKDASHASSIIGFVAGIVALLAFGASNFMVPALVLILAAVTLVRGRVEGAYGLDGPDGAGEARGVESDASDADASAATPTTEDDDAR